MKRIVLLGFAALLFVGTFAGATPAGVEENAAMIFAAVSELPGCAASDAPEPFFAQATDFTCGLCSVPSCQGASPTTYCGVAPNGDKKYCQATTACSGEGILVRRCLCVVGGDIIP